MGGIEFYRPLALLGLFLPVLVLVLSKTRVRPTPLATGAFSLWQALPISERGDGRRRRIPPERWLIALALVCGCFALSEPRRAKASEARTWLVVVDVSPSMYLEHGPSATRMEHACEQLYALASAEGVGLSWSRSGVGGPIRSERLPASLGQPPSRPSSEPRWASFDRPDVVWLTDRTPGLEPRQAGLVASGGPLVPGPVGTSGSSWLDWDGKTVVERVGAPGRGLHLSPGLPGPIQLVAEAWASERGLGLSGGVTALRVEAVVPTGTGPVQGSRDGWSVSGVGGSAPAVYLGEPCTTWLAGGAPPRPLVTWAPGNVWVALSEISEPLGGSAAWAVSWADLLDGALLPSEGVVSSAERAGAGEAASAVPRSASRGVAGGGTDFPLTSLLSGLASALAALALVLGRGRL